MPTYTAAKSRSPGRTAWAIAFRHPAKPDPRTNSGVKVRRGLGTSIDAEADALVAEMNQLLSDDSWWNVTQRDRAAKQFSAVIVSAFYDPLEPEVRDTLALREAAIPMPGKEDGYPRVLFVGTTGAGKTTLLRHLIGSDPKRDRFPSTSAAKTTIADIEVITSPQARFEAVVTFFDEWRIHTNVVECVVEAGVAAREGLADDEIADRLLHHSDQKFRLSYVLGRWKPGSSVIASEQGWTMDDDAPAELPEDDEVELSADEAKKCQHFLEEIVSRVKDQAKAVTGKLVEAFGSEVNDTTGPDYETYQDIFEAEFESAADDIVKDLMDEIRVRFDAVADNLDRRKSGWPETWRFSTEDRDEFIREIRWFSSNHSKSYGRLLTPIVDGLRVKGPLYPTLTKRQDKLVLIDGQGLGHTAESSSSVTTHVTERFGTVDAILLVDSAAQPMQAAPLAAIRAVLSSGHQGKLAVAFTHFDAVKGDNLSDVPARRAHVMASVRNGITSFTDMGQIAVGALQRSIDARCFMFGFLDHPSQKVPKAFAGEAERLLDFIQEKIKPVEAVDLQPQYDMTGVGFAVQEATQDFNKRWAALLGLGPSYGLKKQHWTRVKALTRRFAAQSDVEYDTLRPVADLISRLEEVILKFLEKPTSWSRQPKDETEAEAVLAPIRQQVAAGMHTLAKTRIAVQHLAEWVDAFNRRGKGSGFERSRQVMDIYDAAAPVPGVLIDRITAEFLQEVRQLVRQAIEANGGALANA